MADWVAGLWMSIVALFGAADEPARYQGYAEADYLRVAARSAGTIEHLAVRRGDRIAAGDLVFLLDDDMETALRDEAKARLTAAEAQLADLRKGARPEEIAALRAEKRQAEASLALSRSELERQQRLFESRVTAESRLDEARSAYARDSARVAELEARLATAELGGRADAIEAAEAEVTAARAALEQAQWRLDQRSGIAPTDALVEDTLFVAGEHVAAGQPVVTLLPPGNLFLRFFVPETDLGRIALGQRVTATCDGCPAPVEAAVSFIAAEAEYTPPVIYSEGRREKLVFMVEARPLDRPDAERPMLHPGQPVTVTPRWPVAASARPPA